MKIICRCEDVVEEEIIELIKEGITNFEEIKRLTRATMGHCQGRTCKRMIAQIISKYTNIPIEKIICPKTRPPIKPVELKILANVRRD